MLMAGQGIKVPHAAWGGQRERLGSCSNWLMLWDQCPRVISEDPGAAQTGSCCGIEVPGSQTLVITLSEDC